MLSLSHTVRAKALARSLASALCLTLCAAATSQNLCGLTDMQVSKSIGDRWAIRGELLFGHEHSTVNSTIVAYGGAAGYRMSHDAVIAVDANVSHALYSDIDNNDTETSIRESISWRRASGFFFSLYFEQRRLFYKPSDYAKNVSCCGGIAGWGKSWAKPGIFGSVACNLACNMKSPNTKAEVIQRIRVPIAIRKSINETIAIGLSYTYCALGDNQIYIADRDRLNTLTASFILTL